MIRDVVKILYVKEGYLPNYPYHLISDEEMCNAFLSEDSECFFDDRYPCVFDSLAVKWAELRSAIRYHLDKLVADASYSLPDWVYSYMLGVVIGPYSSKTDIHDMLVLMGLDNMDDELNETIMNTCYEISEAWIEKIPPSRHDHRPPSIFGEPHVIKSLRLSQSDALFK